MLQVTGSFAKDLLAKYALIHSRKDDSAFSLNPADRKYMESFFLSYHLECEARMFIPIFDHFIFSASEFSDIPVEHRIASVSIFLYELLRYFRNGRRSATLEAKVGEFMVHMSQTHKLKFVPHK